MEGGVMEMTRDELRRWIKDKVKQSEQISSGTLEKCNLLQSLLERRKKQVADLMELCEAVSACEETVKKLYSLLGWEYSDTDSDDDDAATGTNWPTPSSPTESVHSDSQECRPPASNGPALLLPLEDDDNPRRHDGEKEHHILSKELKVVLTRLPASKIAKTLPQPKPQKHCSEDETLSSAESDMMWEPEGDSSDSDFSVSSFNTVSNKRKKRNKRNEKCDRSYAAIQASRNSGAKSSRAETSTPTTTKNICAENSVMQTSTPHASANMDAKSNTTVTPQAKTDTNGNSQEKKTLTMPANTKGAASTTIVSVQYQPTTETSASMPKKEISVNMTVLARRRAMCWQRGTILELVTKDVKVKYKVNFEEKGKSLVSGHHIAFDDMPKLAQLFVGARVVVKSQSDESLFLPGILAEIPNRRNRMRFLVFTDDHMPAYVGLPLLRLVCKPLIDPLDDIKDDKHRYFMQEYMKSWPYPPQTQYKVGQTINVDRNGVQQSCEIVLLDCSLIQVVFQDDQHKEWLYRGSIRLEHMVNMRPHMEMKNKTTSVNGS